MEIMALAGLADFRTWPDEQARFCYLRREWYLLWGRIEMALACDLILASMIPPALPFPKYVLVR